VHSKVVIGVSGGCGTTQQVAEPESKKGAFLSTEYQSRVYQNKASVVYSLYTACCYLRLVNVLEHYQSISSLHLVRSPLSFLRCSFCRNRFKGSSGLGLGGLSHAAAISKHGAGQVDFLFLDSLYKVLPGKKFFPFAFQLLHYCDLLMLKNLLRFVSATFRFLMHIFY
jgi:hypothetical protein